MNTPTHRRISELRLVALDTVESLRLQGITPGDAVMVLSLGLSALFATQLRVRDVEHLNHGLDHLLAAIRSDFERIRKESMQ